MLPIRDHNPSGRTPYVVYALMAANIGIFLMYWPILDDPYRIASFFNDWALIPSEVSSGRDQLGLFTSMFLHGGFMHLAGNMLFLWIFGDNMEDEMGHAGFALFYVLAGLAAGMAQVLSEPYSHIPTVGASGAIAGVMGGYLLLFPKARVDILLILVIFFKVFTIPAWIVLGLWFAFQVFNGLLAGCRQQRRCALGPRGRVCRRCRPDPAALAPPRRNRILGAHRGPSAPPRNPL